ncbi:hypothetical protein HCH97_05620 [Escherichia coli]|uniref:hypothetical protein n=1 Tax=Escherichia TaxID=561 RepID=UPI000775327F|nr:MULTISPECIES: hypothetical protein [Escherichia]EEZ7036597.1 hypothetical protein [Escherichia coli O175]EIH0324109.1 hypothetical protein [Escherichia coli O112]EFA2548921.1 hypothetical protein [Escherichia coli]EFC4850611.1 hypothetical protein [Escherichia coli]EFN1850890.1 hypothetical protein [Escherichia coli]
MPGTTTAMSINFIRITARTMNSNGSHGKPQIPADNQKLLAIEDITQNSIKTITYLSDIGCLDIQGPVYHSTDYN